MAWTNEPVKITYRKMENKNRFFFFVVYTLCVFYIKYYWYIDMIRFDRGFFPVPCIRKYMQGKWTEPQSVYRILTKCLCFERVQPEAWFTVTCCRSTKYNQPTAFDWILFGCIDEKHFDYSTRIDDDSHWCACKTCQHHSHQTQKKLTKEPTKRKISLQHYENNEWL